MGTEIQKRDLSILKFAFAHRAVSCEQIARRYFEPNNKVNAYRRIRKLRSAGFLRSSHALTNQGERKYVEATEKAWPVIRDHWPIEITVPHFKSESPVHDLRLNEIFFRLEKLKTFRAFYTENLLQSSVALAQDGNFRDLVNLQADAALLLNGPDGRLYVYGIEFEISKKSPERYRDKLAAYYLSRKIDGVIYVCSEREIANSLARIDKELRQEKDSILYFGFENEVLEANSKIIFQNAKEHSIELY